MASSINGWPVLAPGDRHLHTYTIPGVPDRRLTLAKDAAPILLHVAAWYHNNVHLLDHRAHKVEKTVDEGGYNYRKSRVNTSWSNHSSGTAIDLDWSREGAQNDYSRRWWLRHAKQKTELHRFLKNTLEGAVTWGGDWHDRYLDAMHFEVTRGWAAGDLRKLQHRLGLDDDGRPL